MNSKNKKGTKLSVLMSIYSKDNPDYLKQSLSSLSNQSKVASEVVLVQDGPISQDIVDVINDYKDKLNINIICLEKNCGLAMALNAGLPHCRHEIIARMDSDDISLPTRFEKQIAFMEATPDIDVCSAWISEYDRTMTHKVSIRKVPMDHESIIRFAKRRNPINHPAVMFRKSAVLKVGGYPNILKAQDYALWSLMLKRGYRFSNIPEVLLKMRAGHGLMQRRGLSYLKHEILLLNYQKKIGFINSSNFIVNLLIRSTVRLSPAVLKKIMYKYGR